LPSLLINQVGLQIALLVDVDTIKLGRPAYAHVMCFMKRNPASLVSNASVEHSVSEEITETSEKKQRSGKSSKKAVKERAAKEGASIASVGQADVFDRGHVSFKWF
jgi:hypothetical protein